MDVLIDSFSAVQLHAVLDAARAHHAELTFIAEHLPQYLPGQTARPSGHLLSEKASHCFPYQVIKYEGLLRAPQHFVDTLCLLRWVRSHCQCQHTQQRPLKKRLNKLHNQVSHAGPVTRSAAAAAGTSGQGDEQDENASLAANNQRPVSGDAADKKKRRQTAPRRSAHNLLCWPCLNQLEACRTAVLV